MGTQHLLFALDEEPPEPEEQAACAPTLEDELTRLFGFPSFRPGQREVIEAVLAGRDALAVMPTGGGKSLTYSLPACLLPGATLVVSPLISLMQDQVRKLRAAGLAAGVLNSQVPYAEQCRALEQLVAGELELLFVAPERFKNKRFLRALDRAQVSLFAVDEAHCVSQWGHDFRPDYLTLQEAVARCGRPPVLAVTATATDAVRGDIATQLGLKDDHLEVVRGFDRPNLFLATRVVDGGRAEKLAALRGALGSVPPGPGIVYCATRKSCDRVAKALRKDPGGRVGVYHAGLRAEQRARTQERFFANQLDVVVATNAFGLGIDKQDLRFVIHHDLPGSLEAYYQEAGRAGRDGQPAVCALLFGYEDVHLQTFFINTSHPDPDVLRQVSWAVDEVGYDPDAVSRKLSYAVKGRVVDAAVRLLDRVDNELAAIDHELLAARKAHDEALLDAMLLYGKGRRCRRRAILEYFGAPDPPAGCTACDRCRPEQASALTTARGSAASARPARRSRSAAGGRKNGASRRRRARAKAERPPSPLDGVSEQTELIAQLRQLRGRLARRKKVPAYRVLHDKTLLDLARIRPSTREELLTVYGLGERKVKQYGKQLLALVEKYA